MSVPPSRVDKSTLRQALLKRRMDVRDIDRNRMDAAIASHLDRRLTIHPVKSLGIFWPIRMEPDLVDFYRRLFSRGVQLSLPVVTAKDAPLQFAAWGPGDALVKDSYGVPVPENQRFVPIPDALLIPCVGFNSQRFRIGYGGGYYDRTLATSPKPLAIGIAYTLQLVEFDTSPHDVPLDVIVTEVSY